MGVNEKQDVFFRILVGVFADVHRFVYFCGIYLRIERHFFTFKYLSPR